MTAMNDAPVAKLERRHPLSWVPTLYLAQGLPFYAVALVAGQMLKSMGVPNDQIARWTGLLGLAWAFKALWSPFMELAPSRRLAVVACQLIGGACLALVALALQLPAWFALCIALLAIVSLASSTHDIVADGIYIASLDAREQAAYAGWQGAFFNAAKFISLGGLLILAGALEQRFGIEAAWTTVFLLLGGLMALLGLYHVRALPATPRVARAGLGLGSIGATLLDVIKTFFAKPGIWLAILFIIRSAPARGRSSRSARCSCAMRARSAAWASPPPKWAGPMARSAPPPF